MTMRKLAMLKSALVATIILSVCILVKAQDKPIDLEAGSVEISIVLPAGFKQFSEEQMAQVHQKGVPAKFIFNDSQNDLVLVINTFGANASEQSLSEAAEQIKAAAQKQNSHIEWLKQDFISINSQKWLRLSFKSGAGADELTDTYYVTDWAGQYVLLDFSSPAAKYDNYKSAFERSAQSIRLGFIATSIELNGSPNKRPRKKP